MITTETPYKLSEILRDTWPNLYKYSKINYNNKKMNDDGRILDSDRKQNGSENMSL